MSSFSINFQQAETVLQAMNQINTRIKDGLLDMERNVEKTLASWTGDAQTEYWTNKAEWNKAAADMTVLLGQGQLTLTQIADGYGQTERMIAGRWSDARG